MVDYDGEPLMEPYIELTTYDLIPIDVVKIRRDLTSTQGKARRKYINFDTNITPLSITINQVQCPFRKTRGFGIFKIDVTNLLKNLNSGLHTLKLVLRFKDGEITEGINIDFRARSHKRKKSEFDL